MKASNSYSHSYSAYALAVAALLIRADAFVTVRSGVNRCYRVNGPASLKIAQFSTNDNNNNNVAVHVAKASATVFLAAILAIGYPANAAEGGASLGSNAKITTGGASTLQSGRTIAITRGVNLDNSDFSNQNLKGVAFQQSIVRDTNFRGSNLVGASFFDATLDGSDFEGADLTLANIEMAQFKRANLKVHHHLFPLASCSLPCFESSPTYIHFFRMRL
jgi:hypothetical protein